MQDGNPIGGEPDQGMGSEAARQGDGDLGGSSRARDARTANERGEGRAPGAGDPMNAPSGDEGTMDAPGDDEGSMDAPGPGTGPGGERAPVDRKAGGSLRGDAQGGNAGIACEDSGGGGTGGP